MTPGPRHAFFLGGHDLEMVTIAGLLRDLQAQGHPRVARLVDPGLAWGARASDHGAAIAEAAAAGLVPVLVELVPDIPLPPGTIEVDHHGLRSGEPAALRQVFDLLSLPPARWTRHFALVAANDTGHVAALRRIGATDAEVAAIRAADRAAQGITPLEDRAGADALARAEEWLNGSLLVVRLPHGRSAPVADRLAVAGDLRDLLLLCPAATQFFGTGARIAALDAAFPGGWRGGELPTRGYWGISRAISLPDLLSTLG